ncbi:uncharacterized protein LOC124131221 [Haliotis rufescens]|uniref:uncharacterized protein LOC124131221 n=1 Tax=Haliotis rufescens TaxID=6454 RepID=UPI001EAFECBC|nr:uncharacterized protein LOC124131221 [Haliotis rufescens]XP_046350288.1 uncharacterized protein LOC124131221 [Haliotis rufescens]XP_046350289.1 uncharacterized protein LOC124131221 [Haliotis rufescens]XP_046350290.1 uncharacterized protein LOC124131221 [Haliotis rufescens]XP_048251135.1 uncharacterized protein LOC124131221 [Haliotis rufescens]
MCLRRRRRVLMYLLVAMVVFGGVYYILNGLKQASNRHRQRNEPQFWPVGLPRRATERPLRPIPFLVPQIHVKEMPPILVSPNMSDAQAEESFFKFLENKDVKCNNDQRLGHQHDGGWNVCMSPPMGFKHPCLVYSFGIGTDWQFDDAVSKIYGCRVLAYDPSINVRDHNRSKLIQFRELGLAPKNFETPAGWQMKTFAQFLKDNGHQNTYINYVKFDIEYSEWKVIESMLADGSLKNVKQIGFEMHSRELFKVSLIDLPTGAEDFVRMYGILRKLEKHNFRKFNYRKNPFGEYKSLHTKKLRSCCYELHYVNLNLLKPNETIVHTKDAKMFH